MSRLPNCPIIDESRLADIADRFGTPVVVYFERQLRDNARRLMGALPKGAKLAYSIKANPNPFILKTFRSLGLLAEAASEGEFLHALDHGFPPSDVLLGGPGMPESALRTARGTGARAILIESANLIERAGRLGIADIPVLLRVNPLGLESNVGIRVTGMPSPFGIDEPDIPKAVSKTLRLGLDYAGLFLYLGTQVVGARDIAANTAHLLKVDERLTASGLPAARMFDFGGGFPVPDSPDQPELDLDVLSATLGGLCSTSRTSSAETLFESGRYLVDNAAVLLTRVLDLKVSYGQRFAVLDAGINVLGHRQMRYRTRVPEIRPVSPRSGTGGSTIFVGPTCAPIDVVAENVEMPALAVGDLMSMHRFGAYSTSFSPSAFCGHGHPAEVVVLTVGTVRLVRQRASQPTGCYLDGE